MKRMTIGTLAAASGAKITTIRYYERAGLMPRPARTAGRHRNYSEDHLPRLLFICKARELEFSIEDIRKLLVLADAARPSCREVQCLTAIHVEKLRKRIVVLVKLEAMLSDAIAHCSEAPIIPCPVLKLLEATDC